MGDFWSIHFTRATIAGSDVGSAYVTEVGRGDTPRDAQEDADRRLAQRLASRLVHPDDVVAIEDATTAEPIRALVTLDQSPAGANASRSSPAWTACT
jgi:hypothetical protein